MYFIVEKSFNINKAVRLEDDIDLGMSINCGISFDK